MSKQQFGDTRWVLRVNVFARIILNNLYFVQPNIPCYLLTLDKSSMPGREKTYRERAGIGLDLNTHKDHIGMASWYNEKIYIM